MPLSPPAKFSSLISITGNARDLFAFATANSTPFKFQAVLKTILKPMKPPGLIGENVASVGFLVNELQEKRFKKIESLLNVIILLNPICVYTLNTFITVDVISAIEFDKAGDHLATGDRGGCVVLFERTDQTNHGVHRRVLEGMDCSSSRHPEYRYKTEFQSHEPEVQEKKIKKICNFNLDPSKQLKNGFICSSNAPTSLRLPMVTSHDTSLLARCRRTFAHAHDYHINSISNNSDGETFISADGLRINLWNLEINSQSFNIVDMKPANMEDLTEVIISADFHPSHCNMLAYSSSKGSIRLLDLRQSALCDNHSKLTFLFYIVPALVEALHNEPDTEICANMLDALNECLEICGQVLDENQKRSILDEIKQVITRVKKHLLNNQLLLLRLICANGGCNLLGAV
ncbi:hypothetical protein LXL04_008187 [Taraxacum kok-saghyz]